MNDESFDRIYQSGRADLNDGIDNILNTLRSGVVTTFRTLHRSRFKSPSNKGSNTVGCA